MPRAHGGACCRLHGYCPNQSSHASRPQHRPIAETHKKLKRQDAGNAQRDEADADGDCRDNPDQRAQHPARKYEPATTKEGAPRIAHPQRANKSNK